MKKLIPTRYDGKVPLGGSTKPWKVFAIDNPPNEDPEETLYVVKLFSPSNVEQQPCIAKEFICNQLAEEFDLFVPECGIINLNSPEFLSTLNVDAKLTFAKKYKGATFASKMLSGALFSEKINTSFADIFERATIFAFDSLILNTDRGGIRNKPNLLIHNENFLLIDHELSLSFIDTTKSSTLNAILNATHKGRLLYPYSHHLFYNSLKDYDGKKENLFDTFQEYLKILNISKVKNIISDLDNNNIDIRGSYLLIEYLRELISNSSKYCENLLKAIS